MNSAYKALLFCYLVLPLMAFGPASKERSPADSGKGSQAKRDSLVGYAMKYLDKPYCYGSKAPKCFDCSGFANFVFSHFDVSIPRSSGEIALLGKFVSFQHARAADLIFFNGRNSESETVGHVGIVTEYKDSKIYFIHASVQAGVIVSHTEEAYYKKRLMFVKRIKF